MLCDNSTLAYSTFFQAAQVTAGATENIDNTFKVQFVCSTLPINKEPGKKRFSLFFQLIDSGLKME